jgi:ribosomal protein S18 acetylase RimI-like enzyme
VSKSRLVPDIELLAREEWLTLRDIRLSALRESPHAFLSTYEREKSFSERRWLAEFGRGHWAIGILHGTPISLLGATREPGTPADKCYLEYLWVTPECRRSGVASSMLAAVLDHVQALGVRTVFLWVLDGNDAAVCLYKRAGFVSNNYRQPLEAHPGRSEELMWLDLVPLPGHRCDG